MDRFKFRVWKQDNWDYNIKNEFVKQKPHYEYFELNNNIVLHKNDIIEQCTGLKDKNGKLIYEGDVLKSIFSDEKLYEVIWCADCYKLRVFTKSSRKTLEYLGLKNTKISYEVIGNIHEGVKNENK